MNWYRVCQLEVSKGERPGQKQTGLAQHAALLDRIAQLCNREQCPSPSAPPPLFLTLRNKDLRSLRTFFTSLALDPSGLGQFGAGRGTEKILPS